MDLKKEFDVVIMLTWSNWDMEPRSNRFHFATRFAKELPTLFIQTSYSQQGISIRPSGIDNLEIIEIPKLMTASDVSNIKLLLYNRGFINPLIWIYDPVTYSTLIRDIPNSYKVFHATENYLIKTEVWNQGIPNLVESVKGLLKKVHLVVYVAKALEKSYVEIGGYGGVGLVVENGCDAEFFSGLNNAVKSTNAHHRPSVIYQGGINNRLDYKLLLALIKSMDDWDFKFCGRVEENATWEKLVKLKNVSYLGELSAEVLAFQMHSSTVGIIPFIQDDYIRDSLPLKAYEYVACGLPVVSVPITQLQSDPEVFSIAVNAAEFEVKIRLSEDRRNNLELIKKRYEISQLNSYNSRFNYLKTHLISTVQEKRKCMLTTRCRVAVLYDSNSTHISTINEYLEAFKEYSKHEIFYIPASSTYWQSLYDKSIDLSIFDVVIVHYSIRLSVKSHLSKTVAKALKVYRGLKFLFIQDEYEGTEIARSFMDEFIFDIVYTCIPPKFIEKVYPHYRYPGTQFTQVLTGYISRNNLSIESYAKPLKDRRTDIAYRGRMLPNIYGKLGYEKYIIGVDVKKLSIEYGLNVDIEVDSEKRIYGSKWYEFLGSARATLGTESGSNIFDISGEVQKAIDRLLKENPNISFEEIHAKILSPYEDEIQMNQISPKIFEAIQLRTALILFEGEYSKVILPGLHYIPLKKDYSNIAEVFEKLNDDLFLESLTSRAYNDIIASEKYSYESFIKKVDFDISNRKICNGSRREIFVAYYELNNDGKIHEVIPEMPVEVYSGAYPPFIKKKKNHTLLKFAGEGNLISQSLKFLINRLLAGRDTNTFLFKLSKKLWRRLPSSFQIWLLSYLKR